MKERFPLGQATDMLLKNHYSIKNWADAKES